MVDAIDGLPSASICVPANLVIVKIGPETIATDIRLSSDILTVTVVEPFISAAGVKVRVPVELIAGWSLKSELLSFDTLNVTL